MPSLEPDNALAMHNIYLVDYKLVGDFFGRIAASDKARNHHFITSVRSVVASSRGKGSAWLIGRLGRSAATGDVPTLERTREVVLGILSRRQAACYFCEARRQVLAYMDSQGASPSDVTLLLWNGATVMGEVARSLKAELGVKTIYFELSNLPGKLFVDPEGTNAQSRLFREPEILARYPDSRAGFTAWRQRFIEEKRAAGTVPQAATGKRISAHHIGDFVHGLTLGYRSFSWTSVHTKLKSMLQRFVGAPRPRISSCALPAQYVFFPMQVSKDTQLVLNSSIDNVGALRRLAETSALPVVIKPHPAEYETGYLFEAVAGLAFAHPATVTEGNTTALIEGAAKVVTINSTTGLEAIILGRPVEFLAASFYASLNEENLPNYVMGYLVDLNFFDPADRPVPGDALAKIYERALL